ncbi:DUF2382 domain-containing protein [Ornithinimicrobium cerasi]|uniref:DUF2382 domain-containing protein n=1 Tax=Ornithinimicrobium cerasi TaxID=2248773 RepID=UPI000EFF716B|nr:PRC and DUF2382 domain-containing protein [Ornithinimicrobium cerasi]
MKITREHIDQLSTAQVLDQDGDTVGKVAQVYLDDQSGVPAWITVNTGFFGGNETFVPLEGADVETDRVRVPFDGSHIKGAPNMRADHHLSESEQEELYRYYGLQGSGPAYVGADHGADGRDHAGFDRDRGDAEARMTLHEERVNVGTERAQTGGVRLRKHVVTEQRDVTVPVEREEYEIVREPVTGSGTSDRSQMGDDEIEVAVHEERPVVSKRVVATEQVGVDKRTVTQERAVTTDVSHEEVDVVDDRTPGRR